MDLGSDDVRERAMSMFRAAQVGSCVSSVTHDVNNSLGAIMAYADLLGMSEQMSPESQRMLDQISSAVQKCSDLITSLTSIARKERPDVSVVDVGRLCAQVVELRCYDFRTAQVDLKASADPDIPSLVVDAAKLKMAIIYLLGNALDVFQERPSEGSSQQRGGRESVLLHVARTDDGVEIVISNSGPPVPASDRGRIFEPFFTTKAPPHLGLGLSVARDIVRLHDGDLAYNPDRGFVIHLPRSNRLSQKA